MKNFRIKTWVMDGDDGGGGPSYSNVVDNVIAEFRNRHGRKPNGRELDAML